MAICCMTLVNKDNNNNKVQRYEKYSGAGVDREVGDCGAVKL